MAPKLEPYPTPDKSYEDENHLDFYGGLYSPNSSSVTDDLGSSAYEDSDISGS